VEVAPEYIAPLRVLAAQEGLSTASLCRVALELLASGGTVNAKTLRAEIERRRAE
jgi:hypothetical protein